ncbi:MAG: exodeoxyribonuclease VII small subunit [Phycisphaerae bacterium]|nr:exodeoxyribonuclease VII small subunit [Phycisphaerae bacterium]
MTEQKVSFEQALAKLERIVAEIEAGKVPLEKSIEKYAEGVALIKQCRAILASAESKIKLLTGAEGQAMEVAGELDEPDEGDET